MTSFSLWLACWSVRVVTLLYGRESTELVSIWFVFQFYLALYLHVLYFYFSFHRSIIGEKSSVGIACFQVWSMDDSKRLDFGFDSGRGMSLDCAGSGMDRGLPDLSIQLPVVSTRSDISIFLYLLVFLRMCFYSHWTLRKKVMATIFVPGSRRLLALDFWNRIWKGTHKTSEGRQCSGQILARK